MEMNGQIKIIPEELASQIAAGEVIERPANVIKELMENGLDAGADEIEIEVSLSRRRMRVRDNGIGIQPDEIDIAIARHGTSKVATLDDIFEINTYGFRGEALPSIASVSKFTLASCRKGQAEGRTIIVEGGKTLENIVSPAVTGTEVIVENLFFNTPARRKFARANSTEMGHITARVIQTALATPSVRYTYIKEKKRVFELSPTANLLERVHQIFGTEYSANLIPIEYRDGVINVSGLAGKPGFYRATNIDQYFFVNGRPVRDPLIRMGVARSFDGLLPKGKKPVIFLNLTLPQREVDVNVHPTKAEVRFSDPGRVSSAIVGSIRKSLERAASPHSTQGEYGQSRAAQSVGGIGGSLSTSTTFPNSNETGASHAIAPGGGTPPPGFERSFELWSEPIRKNNNGSDVIDADPNETIPLDNIHGRVSPEAIAVGQVFQTFILIEDGGSLLIMDQHTVHERTLYEKFLKRFRAKGVERQKLLIPETVKVAGNFSETVRQHFKTFDDLGWTVEEFGEDTFMIREVPLLLSGKDTGSVFIELAETIDGKRDSDYEAMLHELVSRMACRSAVMAGDKLTRENILSMVQELGKTDLPYTCPHGRPIAYEIKRESLLRHFGRNS